MFRNYNAFGWENKPSFLMLMFFLTLFDLVLRGFALWRSARKEEKWWFIALLVVNSIGILPGIYLLTHSESKSTSKKK